MSPLRFPQIGVQTSVLSHDGSDLAAALETIVEIGDEAGLNERIADAFRGADLQIDANETLFSIHLEVPGLLRTLDLGWSRMLRGWSAASRRYVTPLRTRFRLNPLL